MKKTNTIKPEFLINISDGQLRFVNAYILQKRGPRIQIFCSCPALINVEVFPIERHRHGQIHSDRRFPAAASADINGCRS